MPQTTEPLREPLAKPAKVIRRVAFAGTPPVAAVVLKALIDSPIEVATVISQPDRRRGRGKDLVPSAVKQAALANGLDVTDDLAALGASDIDLTVVVAYGRIVPRSLLETTPMVNLHFSLLPRWRGAAPVERAILAGDEETGVCLMAVAEGLDTGDVYARSRTPIGPDETAEALRSRLAEHGAELLVARLLDGLGEPVPQSGEATYAKKIERDETELDFTLPAAELQRRVRVGRAWTRFRGKRLGVEAVRFGPDSETNGDPDRGAFEASPGSLLTSGDGPLVATGEGSLCLVQVKPEGKRSMDADDWANGMRAEVGESLG